MPDDDAFHIPVVVVTAEGQVSATLAVNIGALVDLHEAVQAEQARRAHERFPAHMERVFAEIRRLRCED